MVKIKGLTLEKLLLIGIIIVLLGIVGVVLGSIMYGQFTGGDDFEPRTYVPVPTYDGTDVPPPVDPPESDIDGDGVADEIDNCPFDSNPGQEDSDGDGLGDACDTSTGSSGGSGGGGGGGSSGSSDSDSSDDGTFDIEITHPGESSLFDYNETIELNYTIEDSENIRDSCEYYIDDETPVIASCDVGENSVLFNATEGYHTISVSMSATDDSEVSDEVMFLVDLPGGETFDCQLTEGSWNVSEAVEGDSVDLIVDGIQCDGGSVSVTIYEFIEGTDDLFVTAIADIAFTGTKTIVSWDIPSPLLSAASVQGERESVHNDSSEILVLILILAVVALFIALKSRDNVRILLLLFILSGFLFVVSVTLPFTVVVEGGDIGGGEELVLFAPPDVQFYFNASIVSNESISVISDILNVTRLATDSDNDGIIDEIDNCPFDSNPGQEDNDGDGIGDACDSMPFVTECNDGMDNDGDGAVDYGFSTSHDTGCSSPFDDDEEDPVLHVINWDEFPEFSLHDSLRLVYQGPNLSYTNNPYDPLQHGFTQIEWTSMDAYSRDLYAPEERAILWTGIPNPCGSQNLCPPTYAEQPWEHYSSPWANDPSVYDLFWNIRIDTYGTKFSDTPVDGVVNVSIIAADVEKRFHDDSQILLLRNDPHVPAEINQLSDEDFITYYKNNMTRLYISSQELLDARGFEGVTSSYLDSVVEREAWFNVYGDWDYWTTNIEAVSYLFYNWDDPNGDVFSSIAGFGDHIDWLSPSAYFIRGGDYPDTRDEDLAEWNRAGDYLAYLLFQLEVNRAWSDKPVMLWEWTRYHPSTDDANKQIRPHMAHSMGLFAFAAGADGVWLWDWVHDYLDDPTQPELFVAYEQFVYGMYRLSFYNEFFEGSPEFVMGDDPYVLVTENKPVWRGVVNTDKTEMLVIAHNPYAEFETTTITIEYNQQPLGDIGFEGRSTYVGVCQLDGSGCVSDGIGSL